MEFRNVITARYSCRKFSPQKLSDTQINAILEAGRLAPTAKNLQPQRLFVITKDEDLAKVDQASPCRYGAPVVIAVGYDTDVACNHAGIFEGEDWSFGDVDCTIVMTHMILQAADLNLATCWIGAFSSRKMKELFPIPENVELRALLVVGRPDSKMGGPFPAHKERLAAQETITWL